MPKRDKTPDPADDEPRFLIINYPYPAHANLEEQEDTKALARWLGCIISPQFLIALHHMPSARNMVIVEIERNRPREDWRKLLGIHKWKNILVSPTEDEKDKSSRIYFCKYNTGRQVQKSGWKRVFIQDTWFMPEKLAIKNNRYAGYRRDEWETMKKTANLFRIPYPFSAYCDLPTEDPTNQGLCRPLPVEHFPRITWPADVPPLVVGSDEWVDTKLKFGSGWKPTRILLGKKEPEPASLQSAAELRSESRGRTPALGLNGSGYPLAPPQLPNPFGRTLPPDLLRSGNTTANGSTSSLELLTDAMLRIEDEHGGSEEAKESLDYVTEMSATRFNGSMIPVRNSLWDDSSPKAVEGEEILCGVHHRVCSKGICPQYAEQVKEQERKLAENNKRGVPMRGRGRGGRRGAAQSSHRGRDSDARPKNSSRGGQPSQAGRGVGRGVKQAKNAAQKAPRVAETKESTATGEELGNDGWENASMGPW